MTEGWFLAADRIIADLIEQVGTSEDRERLRVETAEPPPPAPSPRGTSRAIRIAGRAGIPTPGVDAVVVNLTGIDPTTSTYLTAYPSGGSVPNTSTINLPPNGVTPNLAVVKLGPDGTINIYNAAGTTPTLVDILGYIR